MMIDLSYPRDLVMIGAVFGLAAFIWSGWAQEEPPSHPSCRFILGGLSVAGLALTVPSVLLAISHWSQPSAISTGTTAFIVYIVVVWAEIIGGGVLSVLAIRSGHSDWVAPLILAMVGIHFFALAVVFGQPVLHLTGVIITLLAVVAFLLPRDVAAASFWGGMIGAPVFLAIGLWCLLAGRSALAVN
ncbi:hypothetical protein [Brevibacterium sp. UCMA 11754]|uniref:hypothetical protein n=1 Tax=Brevibacterium sp. UCMA 11754 TaxID=2749198 RepID=UPI001F1D7B37|nr:hypothetical protein [Brevibacterium sp. UCMA 11754]MCF2573563.1 hypothetical protein [Brevibacterium sp. UCMA 11754]